MLELIGLEHNEFLKRYPHELSGGQKQRVGLARALAADPPIVLLDEPFGALDPITRTQIRKEFKNLEALLHKTMIMVTHDVTKAFQLGDKICLIEKGQIQQTGTPKQLIFSPANSYVKSFCSQNRLQLELQVVTLKDIINEVERSDISNKEVKEFNINAPLIEVLETTEKSQLFLIKDHQDKSILATTTESVISAFFKVKMRLQR